MGVERGGILSLAATLEAHWDAVEADFERFYHKDLRMEMSRTGIRRLYALVRHLPLDAALWREQAAQADTNGDGGPQRVKTSDPNQIAAFFKEHMG